MLNNKTTHNPNSNIVWSDSPNSIFKLAYLSEEDIKYYCFGDGPDGGDSDAVDAASDMGEASAGTMGVGPAAQGASDTGAPAPDAMAGPAAPGATTSAEAAAANVGFDLGVDQQGKSHNPGVVNVQATDTLDNVIPKGLSPELDNYTGYEFMGINYNPSPVGSLFGGGHSNIGFSFDPGEFAVDVLESPLTGLGLVGMLAGQAARTAGVGTPSLGLGPHGQAISGGLTSITENISDSLDSVFSTDGIVGEGLTSLSNAFGAQSGGNIGGLMNNGLNIVDVMNKGIAIPDNIGTTQMQEKIDVTQSNPYMNR
jgi:hypothetical protein